MKKIHNVIKNEIIEIKKSGLFKNEQIIETPQSIKIKANNKSVINFCANNYLGLSGDSRLIKAAKDGLDAWGYGLSSVRFICGTQSIHKTLERKLSSFLSKEDTILYTSCYDANGGLFETLLGSDDIVISDQLNHASIIDGIRLCKAKRERYPNSDMVILEKILKESQSYRYRLITTDGVFSMDGNIAKLDVICSLAKKYNALVHVDDSHATGLIGKTGRGSIEYCDVIEKVDIVTSTLGKALGGASGGFTSSSKDIITILRQKSRPYLFSNTVAPSIVSGSIKAIDILTNSTELRDRLEENTFYFRSEMIKAGFKIKKGIHPIVPVMLNDEKLANDFANDLFKEGIYVVGFSFPVVPRNQARIRVQISALHKTDELNHAINSFIKIGGKYKLV